jgi:two-component system NtrC family sensor kinase
MTDNAPLNPPGASNEFYHCLFEHAAVAMIATDTAFNIVSFNAAAAELLGRAASEMIGTSLYDTVPANRRKLLHRLLERTTKRMRTSQLEVQMPVPDGEARDLMVILSPIPDEGGAVLGVAAWVIDETHRKRLADRLAQAEKIASLGTLAGGVAHHFNNILGGVTTFVDYAITSGDPVAMKRALQMTAEAATRASNITQSLLSFAKCDGQKTDMADLTEVVLTFVHLVERPLAERGIQLNLDLRSVPIIPIEANRMHQVLGNLLTNAEEALPGGGAVSLSLDRSEREILLTFADTGGGIKAKHLPLVFEPFFTTKGLLAGGNRANPGLGLSVAHGIIVEMGGRIEVQSELDKGTRFTIAFPLPTTKT